MTNKINLIQMQLIRLLFATGLLIQSTLASFHLPSNKKACELESIEHDPDCPFYEVDQVAQGTLCLNPVFHDAVQEESNPDKITIPNECPCTWCRSCPSGIIIPKPGVTYRMICYSSDELTDRSSYPEGFTGCYNGGKPFWLKIQTENLVDRKCWKKFGLVDCQRLHPGSKAIIKSWVLNCVSWIETSFQDDSLGKLVCINVLA